MPQKGTSGRIPTLNPSQAQILLAWDECGDVIHCNDSILPVHDDDDDKDAIASSLLRQCGANIGGVSLPQKQQQQHLDSRQSRITPGNVRGNNNDKSLLLLGCRRQQQEAFLRKITQMEYVGIKDSEEMEELEAELNRTFSRNCTCTVLKDATALGFAGRPFSLSNCEMSINSHDGFSNNSRTKENSRPSQRRKEDSNPLESSKIIYSPYTTISSWKMKQKGGTRALHVPARTLIDRSGKQPLQHRRRANSERDRVADKDDYKWNDGNLRALQRKMEASRDIVRDIGHAIEGDMLHVHQSCRAIANIRRGKQPLLREELHRLAAKALASICVKMSHRLGRCMLNLWSQGVRQDIRREQLLKLRQCHALDRLVVLVKHLSKERLELVWLYWFDECQRRRQLEFKLKSTLIQSAIRRKLAVKKLEQKRTEKRDWARRTIQRLCRGCSARMVFRTMIRQSNRLRAALVLQRFVRSCSARKKLRQLRLERRRKTGAVMMQKISRGRKGRKIALQALDCRRRRAAAVHIQRISRGRRDRIDHAKHIRRLALIKRNTAATALQAQIRRYRDNKIVEQLREQRENKRRKLQLELERTTTILQRIYRGHQVRLTVRRIQHEQLVESQRRYQSATCIQSFYRSRLARERVVRPKRRNRRAFMIREARQWIETWKDDENAWCYYNKLTGEILPSPPITGYSRLSDDVHGPLLFLQSGVVILDPSNINLLGNRSSDNASTGMSRRLSVCQGCDAKSFTLYCKECAEIWSDECDSVVQL